MHRKRTRRAARPADWCEPGRHVGEFDGEKAAGLLGLRRCVLMGLVACVLASCSLRWPMPPGNGRSLRVRTFSMQTRFMEVDKGR
jgi:hypothetical protein